MAEVESFTLDHTAVKAPYVRLITVEEGPKETRSQILILDWSNQMKMRSQQQACIRSSTC